MPQLLAKACRAQSDSAFLESCWQRPLHKLSISKSLSGVKDQSDSLLSTFRTSQLYDAAVAQPQRPIYLENGMWGPAYMDAYWYATVEGRPLSEFVRLAEGAKPPSGAIVLSSNSDCQNCEVIQKSGAYLLYRAK